MSQLLKLVSWNHNQVGHVIFIHGLGGHAYNTWRKDVSVDRFWPHWLGEEIQGLNIWSFSYSAPPSNWLGTTLDLDQLATNLYQQLTISLDSELPIVFICHSLGGVLVKQLVREIVSQSDTRPDAKFFVKRLVGIIFIATPHAGSQYAKYASALRLFVWPSVATQALVENSAQLRELNVWYRNRNSSIKHQIYMESRSLLLGRVVNPSSADAAIRGVFATSIERNHIDIAKPISKEDQIYKGVYHFLAKDVFKGCFSSNPVGAKLAPIYHVLEPIQQTDGPLRDTLYHYQSGAYQTVTGADPLQSWAGYWAAINSDVAAASPALVFPEMRVPELVVLDGTQVVDTNIYISVAQGDSLSFTVKNIGDAMAANIAFNVTENDQLVNTSGFLCGSPAGFLAPGESCEVMVSNPPDLGTYEQNNIKISYENLYQHTPFETDSFSLTLNNCPAGSNDPFCL